jgi:hypothetical protein
MNKYFYVPVTSRHIKYDGKSLLDVTGAIDSKLKDRELGRVELIDKDNTSDSSSLEISQGLSQYNLETSLLFKNSGIPERLLLIKDEKGIREIFTEVELSLEVKSNYLSCFEISPLSVSKIIDDESYFNLAINYFAMYNYRKNKLNTKK